MYQVNAYDYNGIPRTWGIGKTESEAMAECRRAVIEYTNKPNPRFKFTDFTFKVAA